MELLYYLVADGYKIKTPLFNLRMRLPGEYMGDETHLSEGLYPEARLQAAAAFRQYLRDTVKVEIAGIEADTGHIGETVDEATGAIDDSATIGNILTVRGHGLKIEGEAANNPGFFFVPASGDPIQAAIIPVNEPRTLKVLVPAGLTVDATYKLLVVTQNSVKGSSELLKAVRRVESDFTVKAVNP
jgi:hypothetical protein